MIAARRLTYVIKTALSVCVRTVSLDHSVTDVQPASTGSLDVNVRSASLLRRQLCLSVCLSVRVVHLHL